MSESIEWRANWEEALEEAKKGNRPLALEFYMEGCSHCARLARETHQDPAVIRALNGRFIPVRLEGRGHMDLVQKFGVRGTPTTLLFTPEGEEKHRMVGFKTAEEYLQELEKAG